MNNAAGASYDAGARTDIVQGDDDVFWLQPRGIANSGFRPGGLAPPILRRLGASLSVGIALNLSMAGLAFAPSAQALEDDAPPVAAMEVLPRAAEAPEEADPVGGPVTLVSDAESPGATATVDRGTSLDCDESEIAE